MTCEATWCSCDRCVVERIRLSEYDSLRAERDAAVKDRAETAERMARSLCEAKTSWLDEEIKRRTAEHERDAARAELERVKSAAKTGADAMSANLREAVARERALREALAGLLVYAAANIARAALSPASDSGEGGEHG